MVAVFSLLASLEALIANLARDAWRLPRPRRQLPARRHKAGHCVCTSVSVCCSLCFQSSPAWSTSECLPGREKPVATRRRRVCNGGPLGCSPHPARGHRPPIRGVLEWGAVNVVKLVYTYIIIVISFKQESMWLLYLRLFCHAQPKKKSRPRPRPGLFFREEHHKKKHATGSVAHFDGPSFGVRDGRDPLGHLPRQGFNWMLSRNNASKSVGMLKISILLIFLIIYIYICIKSNDLKSLHFAERRTPSCGRRRFNGAVKAHNRKPQLPLGGASGTSFALPDPSNSLQDRSRGGAQSELSRVDDCCSIKSMYLPRDQKNNFIHITYFFGI